MSATVTKGLLVRMDALPGKGAEVERMLVHARPWTESEPGTTAWFGVRFGRDEYGIVDVFPDDAARAAHLAGPVVQALATAAPALFAGTPTVHRFDVLADKLPHNGEPAGPDTKGLLLTFQAKVGKEAEVAEFLESAQPIVEDESETTAWFALRLDDGLYGIFDVFPDSSGRFKHLVGQIPRELAKHAPSLLGSLPDPDLVNVVAEKLPQSAS